MATNNNSDGIRPGNNISHTIDAPFIEMTELLASLAAANKGGASETDESTVVYNMAQGVSFWDPPAQAIEAAKHALDSNESTCGIHKYGSDMGIAELRQKFLRKLEVENNLTNVDVMITAGANQAFYNLVVALCDPGDEVILFKPYYFNNLMALTMTGVVPVFCPCKEEDNNNEEDNFQPDLDALESLITPKTRMLVLISPGNPSGAIASQATIDHLMRVCRQHNIVLVSDETYEYFVFDGAKHQSPSGPHVVNLYSFSKVYGMAGYRVGVIAYPRDSAIESALIKVQDTVIICAPVLSQKMALGALEAGKPWVQQRLQELEKNRQYVYEAVRVLEPKKPTITTRGAIYVFVKLPEHHSDCGRVARWLLKEHRVAVVAGKTFGMPGYLRISFGNLKPQVCKKAAERLRAAFSILVSSANLEDLKM